MHPEIAVCLKCDYLGELSPKLGNCPVPSRKLQKLYSHSISRADLYRI